MTPALERVARVVVECLRTTADENSDAMAAFCDGVIYRGEIDQHKIVRAVLLALREPDETMDKAGYEANLHPPKQSDGSVSVRIQTKFIWQAMIDAALGDKP